MFTSTGFFGDLVIFAFFATPLHLHTVMGWGQPQQEG